MAFIEIDQAVKRFGSQLAVDHVSLNIEENEFVVLLGPSGCGKTTLLRSIVGLETLDGGSVRIDGVDMSGLPPRRRNISMVFQSYAVFPHMTVFENIAFGLRNQKMPDADVKTRVHEAAEMLHITELLDRKPAAASGGQRQRIAVARAVAMRTKVLLMDEPLSNLDALLRMEMRAELKRLMKEIQVTVVYVTHDQLEAMSMGDRIAVMQSGRLLQVGPPLDIYNNPATRFVGSFIGTPPMNLIPWKNPCGPTWLGDRVMQADVASKIDTIETIGVRAESITLATTPGPAAVESTVLVGEPLGSHILYTISAGGTELKVAAPPDVELSAGTTVWLSTAANRIVFFDREGSLVS